ncbi:MAG: hypothetical protein ACKV2T_19645 [Kofleriaceae bacterium]
MRSLLLLAIALGACDLQPPPKKSPPPPTTPTDLPPPPTPNTPPPPEPVLVVDAGVGAVADAGGAAVVDAAAPVAPPDAVETSAPCNDVGVKVAASIIETATDPAQKAALTQERDRIVRRVAEACTRDGWTKAQRDCFLTAKTAEDMQACGRDLAAPRE